MIMASRAKAGIVSLVATIAACVVPGCGTQVTTTMDLSMEEATLRVRRILKEQGYGIEELSWREGRDGRVFGFRNDYGGGSKVEKIVSGFFGVITLTLPRHTTEVRLQEAGNRSRQEYQVYSRYGPLIAVVFSLDSRDQAEEERIASAIQGSTTPPSQLSSRQDAIP